MSEDKGYSRAFTAEWSGPPRRKLHIWQEPPLPNDAPPEMVSGWGFSYDELDENDEWQPGWDSWEATYSEILRYPPEYAPKDIDWFDADTGEPIDIYNL